MFKFLAFALAAAAGVSVASAQPASNPVLINPNPAPKKAPATTAPHVISTETSATLKAASPQYAPPPPKPVAEPKKEEEEVDARDVDKPRNGIIRLNRIYVRPTTPFVDPTAVNTTKGAKDVAVRKYISEMDRALNRFTIPLFGTSMEARALAMKAEDDRLQGMSDTRDMARMVKSTNSAQGDYIMRESQKTFMRTSDFGWNGGGPK